MCLRSAILVALLSLASAGYAVPARTQRDVTPCDSLIMAMESLESLQSYLQGLMITGGTTRASRPQVQALFSAMDAAVNDINGVYTALPACKPVNDLAGVPLAYDLQDAKQRRAGSPCATLNGVLGKIDDIESQTAKLAAADPKTDVSPLKARLDDAEADLKQAVAGFTSSGVCAKA